MAGPKNAILISKTTNTGGIITYQRGTAKPYSHPDGICLALTVLWLRNLIEFNQVTLEVDLHRATILYGYYHVMGSRQQTTMVDGKRTVTSDPDFWDARIKLFASQNLKLGNRVFGTCEDCFEWLHQHPYTYCSIKVPKHAMAAYYEKPNVFLFDPNEGIYMFSNINDFMVHGYTYTFLEYCDYKKKPPEREVFVAPVTGMP